MSLSGWIYLEPCTFNFFESMFSVSTQSSVTSMISVAPESSHSASETGSCSLALLLNIPLPVTEPGQVVFLYQVYVHALSEDTRVFLEQPHFSQCC